MQSIIDQIAKKDTDSAALAVDRVSEIKEKLKSARKKLYKLLPKDEDFLMDEYCDLVQELIMESEVIAYKKGVADGIAFAEGRAALEEWK